MNTIGVLFGGVSPEHEVSIITGLQVIEKIDTDIFRPIPLYLGQDGFIRYCPGLKNRKDFKRINPVVVNFGKDTKGVFIKQGPPLFKKIYLDAVYLAFHGGTGESGQIQGMMETLGLPYTSPAPEASCIAMNKKLTKEVLDAHGIGCLRATSLPSSEIWTNKKAIKSLSKQMHPPVIIKPVHLGSSIGIKIAHSEIELHKYLLEASFVDTEVLIEPYIKDFKEYNCAVRLINGKLEASEIEEPLSHDEILSFADKYQRGGNKKNDGGGMASLIRKLPAPIDKRLENSIKDTAKRVFVAIRAKGMIRVDFMYHKSKLYVVEINPIPGSMAFFLWEAAGISFQQQITDLVLQAIEDEKLRKSKNVTYDSDIIEKFIS